MLITKGLNTHFGATGTGIDAKSGFDLFLNPNLYSNPKGAISNCSLSTAPAATGFTTGSTQPLHCFSTSYSALYSRARIVLTAANATNSTINTAAPNAYLTFFWDGAFNMSAYSGASLQVSSTIGDYYGAWYDWNANASISVTATASGGTDMGELGIAALQNSGSDMVATANNIFFSQPILAPIATLSAYGGSNTNRKVWIAAADTDTASTYTSNTQVQLLRIRAQFTSGTDAFPASGGKLAIFLFNPASSTTFIEPLGPAGVTYTTYPGNSTLNIGTNAVRCFSQAGAQICAQLRRARTYAATQMGNWIDFYSIITLDVNFTASFTASILIRPKHDLVIATNVFRIGFYVSPGIYYISAGDFQFNTGTPGATTTFRAASVACGAGNSTMFFVIGASDTLNKTTNTTATISPTTPNLFASVPNSMGGAVYCVNWDFRGTSFAVSASAIENSADKCWAFDYQSQESSSQPWYCVFCPVTQSGTSPFSVTLTNFMPPPFQTIPSASFSNLWIDTGLSSEKSTCTSYVSGGANNWLTNNVSGLNSTGTYLNLAGHKTTVFFTAPSTLKNVATISLKGWTASSMATPDSSFPYASSGTDFQCRMVAAGSITSYSSYYTCSASISTPVINITVPSAIGWSSVSNGTSFAIILWGMIGSTSASATTANFSLQTVASSANGGLAIDASTTTSSWAVAAGTTTFAVSNIVYQRPYANARGFIRWDFYMSNSAQRQFFSMDKLVFGLDAFINSTVNNLTSIVKCRITDTSGVLNQQFRSCTLMPAGTTVGSGTTPTLTLQPLASGSASTTPNAALDFQVNSSNPLRVYLTNLNTVAVLGSIKTIYGTLYFNGNSSANSLTKVSTATDFPSLTSVTSFPTNYPTLTKYWAAANTYCDLVFSIISSAATSDSNRIVITFPSYYQMGLTTRTKFPYCTINGVNVGCVVEAERSLTIYGIGISVNANTAMVIRVSGVTAPASYTVENFWIQIQSDKTDPGTVIYGGTVADTAYAAQTLATLHINWWTVSTSFTRTSSTMTWSFTPLSAADIATTSVVQVIFPEIWGVGYMNTQPTCTVTDSASSASYGKTQYMVGNILSINLTTAISKTAPCLLTCTGMRTPDNDTSNVYQDIIIRTADANGTNVYLHSGMDNVNLGYSYAKSSSLTYLEWTATTTMNSPLEVTRGTYSGVLGLGVSGFTSSFSKSFMISNTNTNFAFYPTQFNVTIGSTLAAAKLGASSSISTGLYLLSFTITDSTTYTVPGNLWVNVTTSTITLNPSVITTITNYYVNSSVFTKSVPIMFDVSNYLPYSDITIIPVLGTGNTNFTVSPTSLTLTPSAPTGYFIFSTTATSTATGSNYVNYTVNGTNAKAYSVGTQMQTLQITADTSNQSNIVPNVTLSVSSSDPALPTQKYIAFTLNNIQYATIYYVVGLPNQIATTLAAIQNNTGATYNINSQNQAQYGLVAQYGATSASGTSPAYVALSNLFPATTYQINCFAVSQFGQSSLLTTFQFSTLSNGGSITRWLFNFTSGYPSSNQRQALLCSICSLVAAPYQFVRDTHGEICGNTTAFYPTTQTNTTGNNSILAIYFSPFPVNSDSSLSTITNMMANNLTTMQAALVAVSATPALAAVTYDLTATAASPTPTFPTSGTTGNNWVYVSGLRLSDAGFIWIILAANGTSTPTAAAIKAAGTLTNSTVFVGYSVQYYYPGGSLISYNFTNLAAGTSYNVFMVGSNNDPSWVQYFTSVQTFTVTTQGSSASTSFAMSLRTVSMFVLALIAALMAVF